MKKFLNVILFLSLFTIIPSQSIDANGLGKLLKLTKKGKVKSKFFRHKIGFKKLERAIADAERSTYETIVDQAPRKALTNPAYKIDNLLNTHYIVAFRKALFKGPDGSWSLYRITGGVGVNFTAAETANIMLRVAFRASEERKPGAILENGKTLFEALTEHPIFQEFYLRKMMSGYPTTDQKYLDDEIIGGKPNTIDEDFRDYFKSFSGGFEIDYVDGVHR